MKRNILTSRNSLEVNSKGEIILDFDIIWELFKKDVPKWDSRIPLWRQYGIFFLGEYGEIYMGDRRENNILAHYNEQRREIYRVIMILRGAAR